MSIMRASLVFLVLSVAAAASAAPPPIEQVRTTVDSVLAILKDKGSDKATRDRKLSATIRERFDFMAMAQETLGVNWNSATSAQKERFTSLFSDLLEGSYLDRIEAYNDEKINYLKETVQEPKALVDTVIKGSGADIPIRYKLLRKGDGWFVYDVVIEEVSLVSNYRSTYRDIVMKSGLDGLLKKMEDKLQELRSSPVKGARK
jgi:phospholipid transport system substrate-binding protein